MAVDNTKRFFSNSAYMTPEGIATVNKVGKEQMARLRAMREQRRQPQVSNKTPRSQ